MVTCVFILQIYLTIIKRDYLFGPPKLKIKGKDLLLSSYREMEIFAYTIHSPTVHFLITLTEKDNLLIDLKSKMTEI